MFINRRKFVQASLLAGAGLIISPARAFGRKNASSLFGIHPFILQNPDAVFVMQTNINLKTNSSAIKQAGLNFGRSVFGLTDNIENGIPMTNKVVIKPNLTCRSRGSTGYTIEKSMGIVTDAFFVEGIVESLKELGFTSDQFYIREVNCPDDLEDGGYLDMAERIGIDLQGIDTPVTELGPETQAGCGRKPGQPVVWITILLLLPVCILLKEYTEEDVLVNSQLNGGSHSVLWDSSNYPSGLYFYRVHYGDFAKSRKMLVFH